MRRKARREERLDEMRRSSVGKRCLELGTSSFAFTTGGQNREPWLSDWSQNRELLRTLCFPPQPSALATGFSNSVVNIFKQHENLIEMQ